MTKTVGLLVGRERTFPDALIEAIHRRDAGVTASYAQIDITPVSEPPPYDVIVDRISHEVTCYQPVLKCLALRGTHVVNNPFWRIADDKAFGTALAARLGVPVPKTFILPSKLYGEDVTAETLHNLKFPLDWGSLPFPLYLKPHWGGGFRDVYRVENIRELWRIYDRTGRLTMIAQEAIEWEQYIRCVVVGQHDVLPLLWDPRLPHHERYLGADRSMPPLSPAMASLVTDHARALCRALGYDMNTCEFAVRGGVPYAIDFMNSAPDFEGKFLGAEAFSWIVEHMASLCIRLASDPPPPAYVNIPRVLGLRHEGGGAARRPWVCSGALPHAPGKRAGAGCPTPSLHSPCPALGVPRRPPFLRRPRGPPRRPACAPRSLPTATPRGPVAMTSKDRHRRRLASTQRRRIENLGLGLICQGQSPGKRCRRGERCRGPPLDPPLRSRSGGGPAGRGGDERWTRASAQSLALRGPGPAPSLSHSADPGQRPVPRTPRTRASAQSLALRRATGARRRGADEGHDPPSSPSRGDPPRARAKGGIKGGPTATLPSPTSFPGRFP